MGLNVTGIACNRILEACDCFGDLALLQKQIARVDGECGSLPINGRVGKASRDGSLAGRRLFFAL